MNRLRVAHLGYAAGVLLIAVGVGLVFSWGGTLVGIGSALVPAGIGSLVYALVIHDVDSPEEQPPEPQ